MVEFCPIGGELFIRIGIDYYPFDHLELIRVWGDGEPPEEGRIEIVLRPGGAFHLTGKDVPADWFACKPDILEAKCYPASVT